MKVSDILNLSADKVMSLSAKELRSLTKTLVDASNKRIKRLEETKTAKFSGAYRALRGGKLHRGKLRKFSIDRKALKVKSKAGYRNKLLKEFARASRFLNDKTSSVAGTRKVVKDVEKRIGKFKSKAQANRFWDAYNAIRKDYGDVIKGRKISTDEIQATIYGRLYKDGKERKNEIDDIIDNMREELERNYVKGEKAEADKEPESPFKIRFEKIDIF